VTGDDLYVQFMRFEVPELKRVTEEILFKSHSELEELARFSGVDWV
jgi:hypothetical protein